MYIYPNNFRRMQWNDDTKRPDAHKEVGPRHQGQHVFGQDKAGRGGVGVGRDAGGGGTPFNPGGMTMDKGVVQGCGLMCSIACSSYPRADHGGEGGTVQLCTTPRE